MPKIQDRAHTTEQEIAFINNLGSFANTKLSRKELLTGYLKGAMERRNWGDVDGLRAIYHARECLKMSGNV